MIAPLSFLNLSQALRQLSHLCILIGVTSIVTACSSMAPEYQTPNTQPPKTFAGYANWQPLNQINAPTDAHWWQVFNDPLLNQLSEQVIVNNQTLKANEAQYRAALATVNSAAAARYPTLNSSFSATNGTIASTTSFSNTSLPTSTSYNLSASASWEMDLWGRIHDTIASNEAKAQASLADLYAARLSTQALLIQTYLQLRNADTQIALLEQTARAYQRFLQLTQARIKAGIASKLDATQAQTQLYSIQAQQVDLQEQRQRFQNAIATLVGQYSANVNIASQGETAISIPNAPTLVPSTLLAQRPDIIASERRVYAANLQIGVAQSAYFPTINLVASASYRNKELANLIDIPNTIWSLGPSAALTLFDGGLRAANKAIAVANMEQAAATYKQTVLTAFQEVEDNLNTVKQLTNEANIQREAVAAASQALFIAQRQYQAGINSALNVITAQTAELTAKKTLADIENRQRLATVILWKNTGNGIALKTADNASN
jgi:NodT family efflux transporter outer membrane factor (OMF) lipoprotein